MESKDGRTNPITERSEYAAANFEGKEYLDWCSARVKLMRAALINKDRELLEQTLQSVVDRLGEEEALDALIELQIELDMDL